MMADASKEFQKESRKTSTAGTNRERVLIMGAAGRDFHDFNVCFRDHPEYEVVAFTAAQIPGVKDRRYPPSLSGSLYPEGIPIYGEDREKPDSTCCFRLQRCLPRDAYASRFSRAG